MMVWLRRIKWIFRFVLLASLAAFLHYSLPSKDIVKIVGTDVKRMDIGGRSWLWASPDAGTQANFTRDVRFINAAWPDGSPRVYRNEDTNWSWPPYFKFDSGNLNAEAQALAKENDVWIAVTHYGWRINLLSMFPNAISIARVAGPETTLIPYFNIAFFTLAAALSIYIFLRIRRFKRRRIDPVLKDVEGAWDAVEDTASDARDSAVDAGRGLRARFRKWFG